MKFQHLFSNFCLLRAVCQARHEGLRRKGRRIVEEDENYALNYGHREDHSRRNGRELSSASDLLVGEPEWLCFSFSRNETEAKLCNEADGLEMPLWWSGRGRLKVTDMYNSGDRFEVLDATTGESLGFTSTLDEPGCFHGWPKSCNGSPDSCFDQASMSSATYCFDEGDHNITIVATETPCFHSLGLGYGEAYFQLEALTLGEPCTTTSELPVENIIAPGDDDNDNVDNTVDVCAGTYSDQAAADDDVREGRWALNSATGVFVTGTQQAKSGKSSKSPKGGFGVNTPPPATIPPGGYTVQDTHGCSCEQIVAICARYEDFVDHGCSTAVMNAWVASSGGACLPIGQLRK